MRAASTGAPPEPATGSGENHHAMKNLLRLIVVLAVLLGIAALTNPSPDEHRAAIRKAVAERSPLAGLLGVGALSAFVSSYHSLGIASYTVVNQKTVTIGAYKMVFVVQ
jgi:hypothetical protein